MYVVKINEIQSMHVVKMKDMEKKKVEKSKKKKKKMKELLYHFEDFFCQTRCQS